MFLLPGGIAYIAVGGKETVLYKTSDPGLSWKKINTPLAFGTADRGIYSIHFINEDTGLAAGGSYLYSGGDSSVAWTINGGNTWHLPSESVGYKNPV